jgi:hypothetical protein
VACDDRVVVVVACGSGVVVAACGGRVVVVCGGRVVLVACGWRWRSSRGGGDEHRGPTAEGHGGQLVGPHVGFYFLITFHNSLPRAR